MWISKALESEKILLLTRTTPFDEVTKKTDGMTLFLTDLNRDHVDIRPIKKMGRNAVSSNEVFIDDLIVPVEDRVGEEGKVFKYILDGLNPESMPSPPRLWASVGSRWRRRSSTATNGWCSNWPIGMNQGLAVPACRLARAFGRRSTGAAQGDRLYDNGKPCGRETISRSLVRRCWIRRGGPGVATARRHGLLRGVPRVAAFP